ncbi:hypothetical protein BIV23_43620 [Streptomyces monashensis]|uniref:Uncharacterized protein n=1 Tax=Streptomyces monashensis TaxID=1678012 RepID=A0A1S2NZ67_9ACTN|nr:hypothetical protein BIV23_43620 [Streptomyces monashensis]
MLWGSRLFVSCVFSTRPAGRTVARRNAAQAAAVTSAARREREAVSSWPAQRDRAPLTRPGSQPVVRPLARSAPSNGQLLTPAFDAVQEQDITLDEG